MLTNDNVLWNDMVVRLGLWHLRWIPLLDRRPFHGVSPTIALPESDFIGLDVSPSGKIVEGHARLLGLDILNEVAAGDGEMGVVELLGYRISNHDLSAFHSCEEPMNEESLFTNVNCAMAMTK